MTSFRWFPLFAARRLLTVLALSASAACVCAVSAHARVAGSADRVADAAGFVHYSFANTDGYQVNENVGNYPLVIDRDDASAPGVVCWGVTNQSDEAGSNFTKINKQQVAFAPGQSSATVSVPINDQGINGPGEICARLPLRLRRQRRRDDAQPDAHAAAERCPAAA